MQEVEVNGVVYEFPDNMSDAQIGAILRRELGIKKGPKRGAVNVSEGGSFIDPMMQGLTFGFADELAGTGARLGAWLAGGDEAARDRAAESETARWRSDLSGAREQWPIASAVTELGSSLISGGPIARFASSPLRMVGIGAGEGALYGSGAADENKATGGLLGGIAGGFMGGAIPAVGYLGGKVADWGGDVFGNMFSRFADDPQTRAGKILSQNMQAAGLTPAQLRARQRQLGPDATLAETAGDAGIAMGQGVIQKDATGRARQMAARNFNARVPGVNDRVRRAVEETTGVDRRLLDTLDEVRARQRQSANDLYARAYAVDIKPDADLVNILNRPAVRKSLKSAYESAANEGRELPVLEKIILQGDDFRFSTENLPDMEALDQIKRHLDRQVASAYRTGDPGATGLKEARNALRSKLDDLNPDYAPARNAFAGDASLEDAMLTGEKFLTMKTREVHEAIRSMTDSEREAFMTGAVEAIREKVGRSRGGEMGAFRFLQEDRVQEKLRLMFPQTRAGTKALAKLMRQLRNERTLLETRNALVGGSQTALRQQAGEMIESTAQMPTVTEFLRNPVSSTMQAGGNAAGQALRRERQPTIDAVAEMLFRSGGTDRAIQELQKLGVPDALIRQYVTRFSVGSTALAPAAGALGGSIAQ